MSAGGESIENLNKKEMIMKPPKKRPSQKNVNIEEFLQKRKAEQEILSDIEAFLKTDTVAVAKALSAFKEKHNPIKE